jgi:hypothetical protein
VTLPDNLKADEATAGFEDGILRLEIPKAEEARPRQIRISPSSDASSARTVSPSEGTGMGSRASGQPAGNEGR